MPVTEATVNVSGMTCDGCERSIAKALGTLEGVEEARPSHEAGTVVVLYDPARVGMAEIGHAIEDAGYDVVEGDGPPQKKLIEEIPFGKPNQT